MPVSTKPRLLALAPINPVRWLSVGAGLLFLSAATLAYAGPPSDSAKTMEKTMETADAVMDAADDAKDVMHAKDAMKGDSMKGDVMKGDAMKDAAMGKGETMMKEGVMDATEDALPAPGDIIMEKKAVPVMADQSMMETAPATSTPASTVQVACPAGTTAQPDGTCMITGDWAGE